MGELRLYTGSFGTREQEGIAAMRLKLEDGVLERQFGLAGILHPSFLASNAAGTRLYAVSEKSDGPGSIFSYVIDAGSGELTLLNEVSSLGSSPCHLLLDATERLLIATNYTGGSVSVYAIQEDGSLALSDHIAHHGRGPRDDRQEQPHPHSAIIDSSQRFALIADMGTDEIVHYRIDHENGKLRRHGVTKTAPGAGPRHMAFHPAGDLLYVINELDSTVSAYRYAAEESVLTQVQTVSTLPESFTSENTCADIHVTPDGRYLYASNRGHDSVAAYRIGEDGWLELVDITSSGGRTPRNFAISPDGQYMLVANQDSDSLVTFRIDTETGRLLPAGEVVQAVKPVCITFL